MFAAIIPMLTNPVTIAFAKRALVHSAMLTGAIIVADTGARTAQRHSVVRTDLRREAKSQPQIELTTEILEQRIATREHVLDARSRDENKSAYDGVLARLDQDIEELQVWVSKKTRTFVRENRPPVKARVKAETVLLFADAKISFKEAFKPTSLGLALAFGVGAGAAPLISQAAVMGMWPTVSAETATKIANGMVITRNTADWSFWVGTSVAAGYEFAKRSMKRFAAEQTTNRLDEDSRNLVHNAMLSEEVQDLLEGPYPIAVHRLCQEPAAVRTYGYDWTCDMMNAGKQFSVAAVHKMLLTLAADEITPANSIVTPRSISAFIAGVLMRMQEPVTPLQAVKNQDDKQAPETPQAA